MATEMDIVCLGLSHRTARVETRERFAVAETRVGATVSSMLEESDLAEVVLVSTCNRVEVYAAAPSGEAGFSQLHRWFDERGEIDPEALYRLRLPDAARHLFAVAGGLDSMVVGETEILGQIKRAYQCASEAGGCGPLLNRLFQKAFSVAKEIRTHTEITRGPTSVGSVAVELAGKIFGRLDACRVMILGAGETSELTARALLSRGVHSLIVANRSFDRAVELAHAVGGEAVRFDAWMHRFQEIDILIGSTAAPHFIVDPERLAPVMARRRNRPLFIIDLAVPRDIDPAVNEMEGVYLYDIDSLQEIVARTMAIRKKEVVRCEAIIDRHVTDFETWVSRRLVTGCEGEGSRPQGNQVRTA